MLAIKGGTARLTFLLGPYAVKIPRITNWKAFLWGLLCNMQEAELGRMGWPELCPVLFSVPLGFVVIMPRVEVCTETTAPTEEDYRRLTENPDRCVPAERKPDSWGRLPNGQFVAIDYG